MGVSMRLRATVTALACITISCGAGAHVERASTAPLGVVTVQVSAGPPAQRAYEESFVSKPFAIPARPTLPSMTLTNGDFLGWVAISSKPLRGTPFLVVLEQDTHLKRPVISVDAVSPPSSALEQGSDAARETRPICTSISAFFLKGLGARPSGSVALWTYDDHRVAHSIEIDPSTATLTLQPILRVPSPDHPKRTDRANLDFYFNVDVASSTERPFLVFALSR